MTTLNIGSSREVFWDDYLLDTEKTTAFHRVMPPVLREVCYTFEDEQHLFNPSISYPNLMKDDNGYRLYYDPVESGPKKPYIAVAVLESKDGIHWTRPHLNIVDPPTPDWEVNNIVLGPTMDGAFVFYDQNPACPPEEKYKAVGQARAPHDGQDSVHGLWCWVSPDGYHFTLSHLLSTKGHFDSLNTMFWADGKYHCYFRGFHNIDPNLTISKATRDVRYMYSEDMYHWSEPVMLAFNDADDIPLYTNNVIPYDRAPQVFVGFPVRYIEREKVTDNLRQQKSFQAKTSAAEAFELESDREREALVTTDCIFMCSRNGVDWFRYNEAFVTPLLENEDNWVYGDSYLAYHWFDTDGDIVYLYEVNRAMSYDLPKQLLRYELRKDGFACLMASGEEEIAVTKPLIFEGSDLHLNFASSAFGYVYVRVLDVDGNPLSDESYELYGNSIDRRVGFLDKSDFSAFAGKPVRLQFRLRDAKLFSMKFE